MYKAQATRNVQGTRVKPQAQIQLNLVIDLELWAFLVFCTLDIKYSYERSASVLFSRILREASLTSIIISCKAHFFSLQSLHRS